MKDREIREQLVKQGLVKPSTLNNPKQALTKTQLRKHNQRLSKQQKETQK